MPPVETPPADQARSQVVVCSTVCFKLRTPMEIPDSPLLCGCVVVPLCACDEDVFVHSTPKTIVLQRAYYWVAGGQGIIVSRRWDANTARGPHLLLTKKREDERERAKKKKGRREKRRTHVRRSSNATPHRPFAAPKPSAQLQHETKSPIPPRTESHARAGPVHQLARATGPVLQANLAH